MTFTISLVQAAAGEDQNKGRLDAIHDALAWRGKGKQLPPSPAARLATQDEYHAEIRRIQHGKMPEQGPKVGE